jgi:hypothetical protein
MKNYLVVNKHVYVTKHISVVALRLLKSMGYTIKFLF